MIQFDVPVVIAAPFDPVDIDTDYGEYAFNVKQINPSQILVTSYFLTKAAVIPAEKIDHAARLFAAMNTHPYYWLKVVKGK